MALPTFYAVYSTSGGNVTLGNIQNFYINSGRRSKIDDFAPGTCIINCRDIASWSSPPKVGATIHVGRSTTSAITNSFYGTISDVKINYGNLPSMDTATITCDGMLALAGRTQVTSVALTQTKSITQTKEVGGISLGNYSLGFGSSTLSPQTYTGNALEIWNLQIRTEMGYIQEITRYTGVNYQGAINIAQRNSDVTADYTLSDSPSSSTELKYETIDFTSSSENYFTQVDINPNGLATQTAGSGTLGLSQQSLDYSTSQALSHAQYLLNAYSSETSFPKTITANWTNQIGNTTRENTFLAFFTMNTVKPGSLIKLVHRTISYYCVIEGYEMAITPAEASLTLTLSAFDNNNYLILNNATFGTLGTSVTYPGNKLGF